ncbi:MAG: ABC transporter ATP-binding protein [Clostridia bacterium]|nr:ABC transporter ATP-binding protein [Clostridia bacterium]
MKKRDKTKKNPKQDKKKEPKLKLGRIISNNLYMLRIMHETAPWYMPVDFVLTLAFSVTEFFSGAFMLKVIVDGLEEEGASAGWLFFFVALLFVIHLLLNVFQNYFFNVLSIPMTSRINMKLKKQMFEKMRAVELSCYEDPAFYEKYVKAMAESSNRAFGVLYNFEGLMNQLFSLVANAILLCSIDPFLMIFAIIPFFMGFLGKKRNKLGFDENNERSKIVWHGDYIKRCFYLTDYSKEMRLSHMDEKLLQDFQQNHKDFAKLKKKYGLRVALLEYLIQFSHEVLTVLGASLYAVYAATVKGTLSLGDCVVVLNSIGSVAGYLRNIVDTVTKFHDHALYIDNLRTFLAYEPKINPHPDGLVAKGGVVCVDHVSYRYLGAEKDAVSDISMTIHPGEKIALVGQNGSGKSTFVKLLLHLYQPTEGSISMDGRAADDYELRSWRACFETVFQDYRTFALSVGENVLLRPMRNEEDRARVTEALRLSGALERVEKMPHGIDTVLTREFDDKGVVLSGGEAQKVVLARVFAGNSPYVILDEPSSALDPVAEYRVFENIMNRCEDRGLIFISHRLSSAVLADRVYLFDEGRILESGSHEELMRLGGKYAEMFHKQAENYVEISDGEGVTA